MSEKKKRRPRREFNASFKTDAVQLVQTGELPLSLIAKELDITETSLRAWVRTADIDAQSMQSGPLTSAEREGQEARDPANHTDKSGDLLRSGRQVRFAHIHAEKARFTVREICETLEVSTSGCYAWAERRPGRSNRSASRVRQREAVREAFLRSRSRYGSPRVHAKQKCRRHRVSRRRVDELIQHEGLVARPRRKFKATTDSKHSDPISPNSRRVVGWSTSSTNERHSPSMRSQKHTQIAVRAP